jgi:hypothetical protein
MLTPSLPLRSMALILKKPARKRSCSNNLAVRQEFSNSTDAVPNLKDELLRLF